MKPHPEVEKAKRRMAHEMAKSLFSKERREEKIGEFNAPPYVINGKINEEALLMEVP